MRVSNLHTWLGVMATVAHGASSAALAPRANPFPVLSGALKPMGPGASTYPRATKLHDDSILGVYRELVDGTTSVIRVARPGGDEAAQWDVVGTVAEGPAATRDIDNPFILQLPAPSDRLLVAFRNHDRTTAEPPYDHYRITVCASDDNGTSWDYLSTVAENAGPYPGLWEPFLRNAADGTLQVYYSRENDAEDQDSLLLTSADGGAGWGPDPLVISGADRDRSRDGMLGVAPNGGTALIAVFESKEDGVFAINSVESPDDGAAGSWGNRKRVYTPAGEGNNAGAPQVVNLGGTLVVSFMTDEDTQQHQWIEGAAAKLISSPAGYDSQVWDLDHKVELSEPQGLWPGLLAVDDDSLLAFVDHDGAKWVEVTLESE